MSEVLIIDDSDFDRRMLRKAIKASAATLDVCELPGGYGAVDVIARERPRFTITDIRMPGMDGFQLLSDIRAHPDLGSHPVIIVSGSDEPTDRELARRHGATAYFTKPPSAADYFALGRDICDRYAS